MKRLLLIILLLFAFNFSAPGNIIVYVRKKQAIEYTKGVNFRELDEADFIRDKITIFLRLEMMRLKLERINYIESFAGTG